MLLDSLGRLRAALICTGQQARVGRALYLHLVSQQAYFHCAVVAEACTPPERGNGPRDLRTKTIAFQGRFLPEAKKALYNLLNDVDAQGRLVS